MNDTCVGRRRIAWAVLLLAALACGEASQRSPETAVTDDAYVSVMVELLLLDAAPPSRVSPEEREMADDSVRRSILEDHDVSAADLIAFAEAEGSDPARMQELWRRITHTYDSLRVAALRASAEVASESKTQPESDAGRAGRDDSTGLREPAAVRPSRQPLSGHRDSLARVKRRAGGTPPDSTGE